MGIIVAIGRKVTGRYVYCPQVTRFFLPLLLLLLLYPCSAFGLDSNESVHFSAQKNKGDEKERLSANTGLEKYPEWYKLVTEAVKAADNGCGVIDLKRVMGVLLLHFIKDTTKSAVEIYDFIKCLEDDDVGRRFIESLKMEKRFVELTGFNRFADVGRFIGAIFYGSTIFGIEGTHECSAENNTATIIFGPNNNCVLTGGDSYDFLFGGDGEDILDGGRNEDEVSGVQRIMDVLAGGDGNDVYMFPKQGGVFLLESNTPTAGNNVLRVGEGVRMDELHFSISSSGELYISNTVAGGGTILIWNWAPRQYSTDTKMKFLNSKIANEFPPIQKIEFFDGSVLNVPDILRLAYGY